MYVVLAILMINFWNENPLNILDTLLNSIFVISSEPLLQNSQITRIITYMKSFHVMCHLKMVIYKQPVQVISVLFT